MRFDELWCTRVGCSRGSATRKRQLTRLESVGGGRLKYSSSMSLQLPYHTTTRSFLLLYFSPRVDIKRHLHAAVTVAPPAIRLPFIHAAFMPQASGPVKRATRRDTRCSWCSTRPTRVV